MICLLGTGKLLVGRFGGVSHVKYRQMLAHTLYSTRGKIPFGGEVSRLTSQGPRRRRLGGALHTATW